MHDKFYYIPDYMYPLKCLRWVANEPEKLFGETVWYPFRVSTCWCLIALPHVLIRLMMLCKMTVARSLVHLSLQAISPSNPAIYHSTLRPVICPPNLRQGDASGRIAALAAIIAILLFSVCGFWVAVLWLPLFGRRPCRHVILASPKEVPPNG